MLGEGSDGTSVFKGVWGSKDVAVKRVLKKRYKDAINEEKVTYPTNLGKLDFNSFMNS